MFGNGPIEMFIIGIVSFGLMLLGPVWLFCYLRSLRRQLQALKVSVLRIETRQAGGRRDR
jgi:hypothetical protein